MLSLPLTTRSATPPYTIAGLTTLDQDNYLTEALHLLPLNTNPLALNPGDDPLISGYRFLNALPLFDFIRNGGNLVITNPTAADPHSACHDLLAFQNELDKLHQLAQRVATDAGRASIAPEALREIVNNSPAKTQLVERWREYIQNRDTARTENRDAFEVYSVFTHLKVRFIELEQRRIALQSRVTLFTLLKENRHFILFPLLPITIVLAGTCVGTGLLTYYVLGIGTEYSILAGSSPLILAAAITAIYAFIIEPISMHEACASIMAESTQLLGIAHTLAANIVLTRTLSDETALNTASNLVVDALEELYNAMIQRTAEPHPINRRQARNNGLIATFLQHLNLPLPAPANARTVAPGTIATTMEEQLNQFSASLQGQLAVHSIPSIIEPSVGEVASDASPVLTHFGGVLRDQLTQVIQPNSARSVNG